MPVRTCQPRRQRGWTLLEPVLGLGVAGVLAATVAPRLIDIGQAAEAVALKRLAGVATEAMVINHGGCLVSAHQPRADVCSPVANCQDVGQLLEGGLPTGYRVTATALVWGQRGACQLVQDSTGQRAGFVGLAAGM